MTLADVISRLDYIASRQPAINTIVENDIFKINGVPDVKYGVFAWTQGAHQCNADGDERRYTFSLFYVDRLRADKQNQVEVQSVAVEVLDNIVRSLADEWGVETWTINTFNQKFNDECAGAWVQVVFSVPVDSLCAEDYGGLFKGDFNYDYDYDFYIRQL